MVFLSLPMFMRARGPDEFWRKRKIFKLAAHYIGRSRNCYSITIRRVHRALVNSTTGRRLKKQDMRELWETRIDAAANEHGLNLRTLDEGLSRCNILINHKCLADLAIWEPRTFKSLTDIAAVRAKQDGFLRNPALSVPESIIVKGLIK